MRKVRFHLPNTVRLAFCKTAGAVHSGVTGTRGEGYVDTAVKILIAVVLGALLLAGLYTLFSDTVLPAVTKSVEEMFNYAG